MNLDEYISYAKSVGVGRVYITTNGALLNRRQLSDSWKPDWTVSRFSINAGQESYRLIHGRDDWDLVVDNIKMLSSLKKTRFPGLEILAGCVTKKFFLETEE